MRRPPMKDGNVFAPPEVNPDLSRRRDGNQQIELVTQVRKYELITPLFGGGVEAGYTDPVTVIRGPGIRGQLRFWWRACRGGNFNGSLEAMKEAEDKLWGAASTAAKPRPSQVQIFVKVDNEGNDKRPFEVVQKVDQQGKPKSQVQANEKIAPSYAAFPLQPDEKEKRRGGEPKTVREGVLFTLTIVFPKDYQPEVEAALWAWETFGGIGARTRRGFGALHLIGLNINGKNWPMSQIDNVKNYINEGLKTHVIEGQWPANVPHLEQVISFEFTEDKRNPMEAWGYLIAKLKDFRQARNGPRGRSKWPEPESIRRLTGQHLPRHLPIPPKIDEFPRAAFGLPIIFHFKDRNRNRLDDPNSDPRDTSLELVGYNRLASPLILRPLKCSQNVSVGLAVILEGGGPFDAQGLVLKTTEGTDQKWNVKTELNHSEAKQIVGRNRQPLLGDETDVLEAFLNFMQEGN